MLTARDIDESKATVDAMFRTKGYEEKIFEPDDPWGIASGEPEEPIPPGHYRAGDGTIVVGSDRANAPRPHQRTTGTGTAVSHAPDTRTGTPTTPPDGTMIESNMTDSGYADRMMAMHGDDCRWCSPLRSWFAWDGTRWRRDDLEMMMGHGEHVARTTTTMMVGLPADHPGRVDLIKRAVSRESSRNIENSLELFKNRVAVLPSTFDRDRWLLNVPNGTVDLRDCTIRPHDRSDMITRIGGVEHDPDATCPRFLAFLDRIFGGDRELIAHIQKLVGMTLSGEIRDHVFTILHGCGANGKTQFIGIIAAILGDYACKVQPETLTPSRRADAGAASSHLARLAGYRFACCDETDDGAQLAESLVKRITGGDRVVARAMYSSEVEFDPQLSLWLDTNHKPSVARGGHAIWRRIQLIPFTVTIPPEEQVPNIGAQLISEEGQGILNWAIEGCRRWREEGLQPLPEAIRAATEAYQQEEDKVGRFVRDECVVGPSFETRTSDVYSAYRGWCEDQGLQAEGQPRFTRRLEDAFGVTRRKGTGGTRMLAGIDLDRSGSDDHEWR